MRNETVGDRVSYKGRSGVVIRDRLNGMVDVAFDYEQGGEPKQVELGKGWFKCSGVKHCIYRDELDEVTA